MKRILHVKECPACGYYHISLDGNNWKGWLSPAAMIEVLHEVCVVNHGKETCHTCIMRGGSYESQIVTSGNV